MSAERPGLKDLYDAISALEEKVEERFVRKGEFKLWLALGLVSGQTVASLVTAYVTHLSPPQQAQALYHLFF